VILLIFKIKKELGKARKADNVPPYHSSQWIVPQALNKMDLPFEAL
jgi:hypothetical protein